MTEIIVGGTAPSRAGVFARAAGANRPRAGWQLAEVSGDRTPEGVEDFMARGESLDAAQTQWTTVAGDIDGFETRLELAVWGLQLRVVVCRKRVHHQSPKNYQNDLFSHDDGYFECSAVATNLMLTPQSLWYFAAGPARRKRPSCYNLLR